ncbi:MAG: putative GNAT family N-acetyltransferase [Streblomastix strix]|uniref:Putative GNAT family N-acetyltransferase n=1 Tax=Streblomastix strix TaxID=222440 RepID=A0A5J4W1T5_9EUKA|nr:MAG: putative GNAT family N-acetyltransferase [Streblomastix strix]
MRQESPNDTIAVYDLIKLAFTGIEHSNGHEQDLVQQLRKTQDFIPELSLLAESEGKIIGHIMFIKVMINDTHILCLAILSVHPDYQRIGIGSALIHKGHKIAYELGYTICVLVGHKDYYPRFGYEIASQYDIKLPFKVPDECVMVKFLSDNSKGIKGMVQFPSEYQ